MKGLRLADASMTVVATGLAGAAAAVTSGIIDLELSPNGDFLALMEFEFDVPALPYTVVTSGGNYIVDVMVSPDLTAATSPTCIQTGLIYSGSAAGSGIAAISAKFRLPAHIVPLATNTDLGLFARWTFSNSSAAASYNLTVTPLF